MSERRTLSPFDEETEYYIRCSRTPIWRDGYKIGEPMFLGCCECGAEVLLTEEPTPGIDDGIPHDPDCSQRWAKSQWWRETFLGGSGD